MLFTWDTTNLCVVFRWWHVRGPWSLLFTLLGVVALGMSYELLRHIARKYDETSTLGIIRIGSPAQDPLDGDRRPATPPGSSVKYKPPHQTTIALKYKRLCNSESDFFFCIGLLDGDI